MAELQSTSHIGDGQRLWQPGMAILKLPQGLVEMVVRLAAAAVILYALLTASAAVRRVNEDDTGIFEIAMQSSPICDISSSPFVFEPVRLDCDEINDLRKNTLASAGSAVGITALALLTQFVMIIIRFLNVTVISSGVNIAFLIIDAALSFIIGLGLLAGGIGMAIVAADYTDQINAAVRDLFIGDESVEQEFVDIRGSLIASTVFSFLAVLAFGFLFLWMILFIVLKWNDKLKNYGQSHQ